MLNVNVKCYRATEVWASSYLENILLSYCPVHVWDIFWSSGWTVIPVGGGSHFNKRISRELEPTFKPLSFSYLCCVGKR